MKPVCVPCHRFFRMKKAGYYFIEGMPKSGNPEAGNAEPNSWTPYKIWVGDLWHCPDCGTEILSGFGQHPLGEHYQKDFSDEVKRLSADQLQVNDC